VVQDQRGLMLGGEVQVEIGIPDRGLWRECRRRGRANLGPEEPGLHDPIAVQHGDPKVDHRTCRPGGDGEPGRRRITDPGQGYDAVLAAMRFTGG
jgi:hypothetical protein